MGLAWRTFSSGAVAREVLYIHASTVSSHAEGRSPLLPADHPYYHSSERTVFQGSLVQKDPPLDLCASLLTGHLPRKHRPTLAFITTNGSSYVPSCSASAGTCGRVPPPSLCNRGVSPSRSGSSLFTNVATCLLGYAIPVLARGVSWVYWASCSAFPPPLLLAAQSLWQEVQGGNAKANATDGRRSCRPSRSLSNLPDRVLLRNRKYDAAMGRKRNI
ncbi:hypothetical protein QBC33DRAFT_102451 [Phialemonium atrogriseum]|uniref:Uncharacterized protein n=1 Tax=Phialemonium atrogriseum TaxID=1093897 RepID=A0AAJ0FLB9_9PEZI|nr:uncharacterized protein QBC33DRAFT_102451 [Phialemonium atrogriseum]KAK1766514.1 hypothetical protein QBC33DRAFT_102451 [Phialemonium atrogriseum]